MHSYVFFTVSKTNVLLLNDYSCWLSMEDGTVWAFIGPVIAVITVCANALIVLLIFIVMYG